MPEKQSLKLLFIGNSHTYNNDMPLLVKRRADDEGYSCHVTMLAHPGWFLAQHARDPEARFNILYGGYNYVVLQEHAHPFGPEADFADAARSLNAWIREAGAIPVIYESWTMKDEQHIQSHMNEVHQRIAKDIDALLAPVGEEWWGYMKSWPDLEMYDEDGAHASRAGSDFAAKHIWETIQNDLSKAPRGMLEG